MALTPEIQQHRKPTHDIAPYILNRWSPRAMTGKPIPDNILMSLFEAARWAPSSYNAQPWRFIYAKRDTEHWNTLFNLMGEFNQSWTKDAAVLVVVISRKNFEHNEKPSVTHMFDAGSAWENLALEASHRNLVAHGMEGFDYAKAKATLKIPDNFEVCAMIAIGERADLNTLPENLQKMEVPSTRRPLNEIIMEGTFKK